MVIFRSSSPSAPHSQSSQRLPAARDARSARGRGAAEVWGGWLEALNIGACSVRGRVGCGAGLDGGLLNRPVGGPQQVRFRREGEQQAQDCNEPDVILPLTADFVPPDALSPKKHQYEQSPGQGHGEKERPYCIHPGPVPFSSRRFSSSYSSSASRSPIIRLDTSPAALPS